MILKNIFRMIITEAKIIVYAFLFWYIPKIKNSGNGIFTYHIKSGDINVFNVIFILSIMEIPLTYMIFNLFNIAYLKLVISIIGDVSLVYIFGICRSLSRVPILLTNEKVTIRLGVLKNIEIQVAQISSVELISLENYEKNRQRWKGTLIEIPNVRISLHNNNFLTGSSKHKKYLSIDTWIDCPELFINDLRNILNNTNKKY